MLIGFTGKMGSGKSTACQYIKDNYPEVHHINMKDGLVREMKARLPDVLSALCQNEDIKDEIIKHGGDFKQPLVYHNVPKWTVDDLFKFKPPVMRALMQNYGTEVRRNDYEDYWVDQWKRSVDGVHEDGVIVVCDDVRFLNEARAVRDMGGIIVRIERPDITDTGGHTSETEMNKIEPDHVIVGYAGELNAFYSKLQALIASQQ